MIEALKMANTLVQNLSVTKTDNTITVSLTTNSELRAQFIKFIKMGIANAKEKAVLEVPDGSLPQ